MNARNFIFNLIGLSAQKDASNLSAGNIVSWQQTLDSDTIAIFGQYTVATLDYSTSTVNDLIDTITSSGVGIIQSSAVAGPLSFARLKRLVSYATVSNLVSFTSNVITGFSVPSLRSIRNNATSAGTIRGFHFSGCTALVNFTCGSLEEMHGVDATVSLGAFFSGCALNLASIANILSNLAAMNGTNGTWAWAGIFNCSGGTSAGHSTWTAQMLADEATIVARGGTVTSNA